MPSVLIATSGGGGGGGGGPAFAPNYNSSASGTSMTSPYVNDRQWTTNDRTAANALGGTSDSYGWTWINGTYPTPPLIDTATNLTSAIGATITAPPDGATQGAGTGTMMAIKWPSGVAIGGCPFIITPPSGNTTQAQKFYHCCYFYVPSNFTQNGNVIKWLQLAQGQAHGACNHLYLLTGNTGPLNAPGWLGLQGDVNGNLYNGSVNIIPGQWNCIEYYSAAETPWGDNNGVFKAWLNGTLIYSNTAVQYFTAFAITSITKANPCSVVTSAPTNFAAGDYICFSGVGGMTQVNTSGGSIGHVIGTITDSQHFTVALDTTGFSTFTSGGLCTRDQGSFYPIGGQTTFYYGGGGAPPPADEHIVVGRFMHAYSNS